MATIKDVAKRANVSTTTVSHVINKTRFVAEETRNAVWAAIKELHYSPSAVARSLKVNHTKSIGLLATSSEAAYFAEIIESVEKSCFQKGYTLILGNAWGARAPVRGLESLARAPKPLARGPKPKGRALE